MNILCKILTEICIAITSTFTTDATNNNNNNNNNNDNNNNNNNNIGSVFSDILSASLSFRCDVSVGCNGGDGFQVWK